MLVKYIVDPSPVLTFTWHLSGRYQYHTKVFPEGMMCDEVSLSWKCGVDIAEIQFLEPASSKCDMYFSNARIPSSLAGFL